MLKKAMHKTRLTQNMKAKHTSNEKKKKTEREREKSDIITSSLFPSTPWKNLSFVRTLEMVAMEKN